MSKLPDFLGLGAQRAGTSWIYACLQEHPEICMPEKELNFFSRTRNWKRGLDWYRSQFSQCEPNQLKGEFSTSYLSDPETPERIHAHLPDIKFIVSLRNPVTRAFSSYKNDITAGDLPKDVTFQEALSRKSKYVEMGQYATHLERYLQFFDRGQFLLLVYERSKLDPSRFIGRIYRFLGVDDSFTPSMIDRTVNESRRPAFPAVDNLLNEVSKSLRSSGFLRPLWWGAKRLGAGRLLRRFNTENEENEEMESEIRKQLNETFSEEIRNLEENYDLDLEPWCEEKELT